MLKKTMELRKTMGLNSLKTKKQSKASGGGGGGDKGLKRYQLLAKRHFEGGDVGFEAGERSAYGQHFVYTNELLKYGMNPNELVEPFVLENIRFVCRRKQIYSIEAIVDLCRICSDFNLTTIPEIGKALQDRIECLPIWGKQPLTLENYLLLNPLLNEPSLGFKTKKVPSLGILLYARHLGFRGHFYIECCGGLKTFLGDLKKQGHIFNTRYSNQQLGELLAENNGGHENFKALLEFQQTEEQAEVATQLFNNFRNKIGAFTLTVIPKGMKTIILD